MFLQNFRVVINHTFNLFSATSFNLKSLQQRLNLILVFPHIHIFKYTC